MVILAANSGLRNRCPSYLSHGLQPSGSKIAALRDRGEFAFREAIVITRDKTIIDGYARWQIAKDSDRESVLCLEHDLSETEALRWLIASHFPHVGLNAYNRIRLAFDLKPILRDRARTNQRLGGQKLLSNLTEAEKVDVRREIAKAAGVSVGNVTKIEQLTPAAAPEILEALRLGNIRIHKAWGRRKMSHTEQREQLRLHGLKAELKRVAKEAIAKHKTEPSSVLKDLITVDEFDELAKSLRLVLTNNVDQTNPVVIAALKVPGKGVFYTKELLDALRESGRQR